MSSILIRNVESCKRSKLKNRKGNKVKTERSPFHLVDPSPWPIVTATGAVSLTSGSVLYMHGVDFGGVVLLMGFGLLVSSMGVWFRDIIREGTYEGHHTSIVQVGFRMGMMLFIVSEVMFFFAFFWAFFWSSFGAGVEIGSVWPAVGITPVNEWEIPLLNTCILLSSGASVTWAHHGMIVGDRRETLIGLGMTIGLAILFTGLQVFEYTSGSFSISDGVYGSTFYMATGFHGFHVIIGTLMLIVSLWRVVEYQFTRQHHFGFEASAWYWHFVDVVWLFLFISVYCWGS